MPGEPRELPASPSLRFLKLEARRRLARGEFPALHDAQQAIAREHGLASWADLKKAIEPDSHALRQLRWIIERFGAASEPGWRAPGEPEMREHFEERFLAAVPGLARDLASGSHVLTSDLDIELAAPGEVRAELGDLTIHLATEPDPPYRIAGLLAAPSQRRIADPRIAAAAPARRSGDGQPPDGLIEAADQLSIELGLPALALAGAGPAARAGGPAAWILTRGWADMDRAGPLLPEHQFPAPGISLAVTAVALLRLVADGQCALGDAANSRLRTMRLADETVTIRDLLTNTSSVSDPAQLTGDTVPDLVDLLGSPVACDQQRGVFRPSNGGAGVLGQIIADITATPYPDAVTRLVLAPLGMRESRFPASTADIGANAVTCYAAAGPNSFAPAPPVVCTIQAAGGLWSTPPDLLRLGTGWAALLPAELAVQAVTSQPARFEPGRLYSDLRPGFGWLLEPGGDRTASIAGTLPGATAELVIRVRDGRVLVILASRQLPVTAIDQQARSFWLS
jgi:CubicO group peptidase (beta-lactamase class C family)